MTSLTDKMEKLKEKKLITDSIAEDSHKHFFNGGIDKCKALAKAEASTLYVNAQTPEEQAREPKGTMTHTTGKSTINLAEEAVVGDIESLARELHMWYLEATKQLNPANYNPKAQVPYDDMHEEQKQIDRYIARKITNLLAAKDREREETGVKAERNRIAQALGHLIDTNNNGEPIKLGDLEQMILHPYTPAPFIQRPTPPTK